MQYGIKLLPVQNKSFNWQWEWFNLYYHEESDQFFGVHKQPTPSAKGNFRIVAKPRDESGVLADFFAAYEEDINENWFFVGEI